jgi:hypothetical protein
MSARIRTERGNRYVRPWLAELVFALDALLRHRYGVIEYTADPACVLRVQLCEAERDFELADGTRVRSQDRLLNLHLWNEHIPSIPAAGPTLGWAQRFRGQLALSFRELARYCVAHPELDDVVAISANLAQGTRQQAQQLTSIMRRFGFAPRPECESASSDASLHRLGENILISVMVLAQNPVALRADSLWRDRIHVFLSRAALMARFGDDRGATADQQADTDAVAGPV